MKKTFIITFLIAGTFLGTVLTLQLRSDITSNSTFVTDEMAAKQKVLDEFTNEQAYLKSRLVSLRKLIDEEEDLIAKHGNQYSIKELNDLKYKVGLTELTGEGMEITIDDSPFVSRDDLEFTDNSLVQASDLRDIVNAIKVAHGEAISINDHRITELSSINSLGASILINNSHVHPPFVISVIGNPNEIKVGLENTQLLGDFYKRVNSSGLIFSAYVSNSIYIPIYDGDIKIDYINLIEQ